MKKRRIMATGSIAVALFLSSYSSTGAAKAGDFREELGIDPTFSVSLTEQGFSPSQIQKIFTSASLKKDYSRLPLSE
jgi:hypothetical protein